MRTDPDATDVVCLAVDNARQLSLAIALCALLAVVTAWFVRDRMAAAGHQTLWALCALLAAALQGIASIAMVPTGCMSVHLAEGFVAATTPWMLTAALMRTGVPPTPPRLREEDPFRP